MHDTSNGQHSTRLGSSHDSINADIDLEKLRTQFWKALDDSPFVMLQLENQPDSTAPMTAQLDPDAHHMIWFFTSRGNRFAEMGPVNAIFASRDHAIFAHFEGTLSEETDRTRIDKNWSNMVEAWYPGGKDDPDLLMLRMELGHASIWSVSGLGLSGLAKMKLGMDVRDDVRGNYGETQI